MTTQATSHFSLQTGARARPVMTGVVLLAALFALFAADVLLVQPGNTSELLLSRIVGGVAIVGYLWLLRAPPRTIGLHRAHLGAATLVGAVTFVALFAVLYAIQAGRYIAAGDQPRLVIGALDSAAQVRGPSFTAVFLLFTLLNSFLEEGLFRGILLPQFMRRMAFWRANVLQAVLFGLWHFPLAVDAWVKGEESAGQALAGGAELFVATATAGLVFGYLYYRTGSLWAPFLAHTIDNLVLNVLHLQTGNGFMAEPEIAVVASLAGYPLLVLSAWAVATHFKLPRLRPWSVEARGAHDPGHPTPQRSPNDRLIPGGG